MQSWEEKFALPVEIRPDKRSCSPEEFEQWAEQRKQLRMESLPRNAPALFCADGLRWASGRKMNYDSENRKPPQEGLDIPQPISPNLTISLIMC